jgi:hypothetical protein
MASLADSSRSGFNATMVGAWQLRQEKLSIAGGYAAEQTGHLKENFLKREFINRGVIPQ